MKQTTNFNIMIPELGDRPDITQVSNAIQDLENALAGTVEVLNATIEGTKATLVSGSRTTTRTRYYEGMAVRFVSPVAIQQNALKTVSIDGMRDQAISIPYIVSAGEIVDIVFSGDKFTGVLVGVPKSNDINSNSTDKVATSKAVNTLRVKTLDDDNSIWGGAYGGFIQDETITKEVGKRYVDEFNKKAYICIKPSNVNTEDAYTECNTAKNLNMLQNLIKRDESSDVEVLRLGGFAILRTTRAFSESTGAVAHAWPGFPEKYKKVLSSWTSVRKDAGKTNFYAANIYWDQFGNFQVACSTPNSHAVDVYAIVELS